jgi:hypothetical protein
MAQPNPAPRTRFQGTLSNFLTSFNLLHPNMLHRLRTLAAECTPAARFVVAGGCVLRALLVKVGSINDLKFRIPFFMLLR